MKGKDFIHFDASVLFSGSFRAPNPFPLPFLPLGVQKQARNTYIQQCVGCFCPTLEPQGSGLQQEFNVLHVTR